MGSKLGAFTVKKGFRKQQRGSDQEFTLQKGVSAAPIKQATKYKPKVKLSSGEKGFLLGTAATTAIQSAIEKTKDKKPQSKKPVGGGIRRFNRSR
jgi:hypothetical protein